MIEDQQELIEEARDSIEAAKIAGDADASYARCRSDGFAPGHDGLLGER